ncbi:enoyl-CoA hydratase/isomerase family protein [Brevibacillus laterosporus]|uniref:Enoyl-CoA hydratase/isomerase family protein n=1 Tax=Brevibacillus laterosporus TaxID=1465 RepID=A0A518VDX4_BRELA|nr:enoyl-CoA hydratase/isomerase family protein [Brevibacillus laterosporus]TPG69113.1 enoyl-CoA hydratase/isomerase family protein [Brevibacillus laterosporus]
MEEVAKGVFVMYQNILVHKQNGIAEIICNRPHVRNALSLEMIEELQDALTTCEKDASIKVILFTGKGSAFVSGGDLHQFGAVKGADSLPLLQKAEQLLTRIDSFRKPTIAMVNGPAIGGGAEFACACHFRFMSELAVFAFVQINMHITTGFGGGSRLFVKLPESRALRLLLTGEKVGPQAALQIGLVEGVYQEDKLREKTFEFAEAIARQPLESISAYMNMLAWKKNGISLPESIQLELEQCATLWGNNEHLHYISTFFRKNE